MLRADALVKDWREASLSSAWTSAEDWWSPAVDAVADAILGDAGDARAACESLGRHRAAEGVFLDEARADVMVAGVVAGLSSATTAELVDGLTIGWVDRTLDTFFTSACLDPMTELATLPYLMTRLERDLRRCRRPRSRRRRRARLRRGPGADGRRPAAVRDCRWS